MSMFDQKRKQMVEHLEQDAYINTKKVKQAFLSIPREDFIPSHMKSSAYVDTPLSIGSCQTISAPHMIAIMCEALDLHAGQTVLEIGTGSGYHAAIIAHIIGESGRVYTIERHENLAKIARAHLKKAGITNVTVEVGDGSKGLPQHQPYDRIYVTCAAPNIPAPLVDQLQDPGMLLIPVGDMYCTLQRVEKTQNQISTINLGGCVFVPLVGEYGF